MRSDLKLLCWLEHGVPSIQVVSFAGNIQRDVQHQEGATHSGPVVCKLLQHQLMVGLYEGHLPLLVFSHR